MTVVSVLSTQSIPDRVCAELRTWISTGRLEPGPVKVGVLAEQFGVSSVPVREALRRLEAEGFVSFNHNHSVCVNSLSLVDVEELFLLRSRLEPLLLQRAIDVIREQGNVVESLEDEIRIMDGAGNDLACWREANRRFHWKMYDLVPLRRTRNILLTLWLSLDPFLRLYVTSASSLETAQDEHRELLSYICSGDSCSATLLLQRHMAETLRIITERLLSVC
ncbi:MAG: GntR family transcriptional regulator [Acidimicrobiales bacterium]